MLIQLTLVFIPVLLFVLLKKVVTSKTTRVIFGLVLAIAVGVTAYFLASEHGWRPMVSGGKTVDLSPSAIALMNGIPMLLVMLVLATAKKPSKE